MLTRRIPLWLPWLAVNATFALGHPWLADVAPILPPAGRSLAVNAVLFLLPALGWSRLIPSTSRALGMRLAWHFAISMAVFFGCLLAFRLFGLTLTGERAWTAIWLVTNVGFLCTLWVQRPAPARRTLLGPELATGTLLFLAAYALFFWGAARVVPPQVDHDLEVQATGYGLVTRFEPLLLTDRQGVYYFAHPPLLHFYVGGSFLLHGELGALQFFDDASRRARDTREGRPVTPPTGQIYVEDEEGVFQITGAEGSDYLLAPASADGTPLRAPIETVELCRIYDRYTEHPYPIETRTPNLFFAAATVALLGIWTARISRRWWLALLAVAAYATTPEVFVRSSYGGYFAIGGLASLLMLLSAEQWRRWPRRRHGVLSGWTGALAALADHKLVFVPAAIGVQSAIERWRTRREGYLGKVFHPAVVGFALGIAAFWVFGLLNAPAAFIKDHVRDHLVDRIAHVNPHGYSGYLTPLGLWIEFVRHTAFVLLPVSLVLMAQDLLRSRGGASQRTSSSRQICLLWMLATAVAFTIIDWRMTKHIIPLLLPIVLGLVPDRDAPRWRVVVPTITLIAAVAINVRALAGLVQDFTSFVITPAW